MFQLTVITPEEIVFDDSVVSVIALGGLGSLEILANHAPLLSNLQAGKVIIRITKNKVQELIISGGLLEVLKTRVYLLADSVEKGTLHE